MCLRTVKLPRSPCLTAHHQREQHHRTLARLLTRQPSGGNASDTRRPSQRVARQRFRTHWLGFWCGCNAFLYPHNVVIFPSRVECLSAFCFLCRIEGGSDADRGAAGADPVTREGAAGSQGWKPKENRLLQGAYGQVQCVLPLQTRREMG